MAKSVTTAVPQPTVTISEQTATALARLAEVRAQQAALTAETNLLTSAIEAEVLPLWAARYALLGVCPGSVALEFQGTKRALFVPVTSRSTPKGDDLALLGQKGLLETVTEQTVTVVDKPFFAVNREAIQEFLCQRFGAAGAAALRIETTEKVVPKPEALKNLAKTETNKRRAATVIQQIFVALGTGIQIKGAQ